MLYVSLFIDERSASESFIFQVFFCFNCFNTGPSFPVLFLYSWTAIKRIVTCIVKVRFYLLPDKIYSDFLSGFECSVAYMFQILDFLCDFTSVIPSNLVYNYHILKTCLNYFYENLYHVLLMMSAKLLYLTF